MMSELWHLFPPLALLCYCSMCVLMFIFVITPPMGSLRAPAVRISPRRAPRGPQPAGRAALEEDTYLCVCISIYTYIYIYIQYIYIYNSML